MADMPIQDQTDSDITDDEKKSLASKLKSPTSRAYLEKMEAVANDPAYAATVPQDTQADLKQALADAKAAYEKKTNQNEWLDVAQTLGRAVTQFGAAQSGLRSGRDMSNLNMGQPIDYNSRSDRAFREYQQDITGAKDLAQNSRLAANDEQARRKYELQRQQDYLEKGLGASTNEERFGTSERNADKRITAQQAAESARMDQQDKRAAEREALSMKHMDINDLNKQELDLKGKLEAARALANSATNDDDLNKKSRDDMAKRYGPLAAKAGVDPDTLSSIGEQSKDKGFLGTGMFRGEDKAKKAELINNQVVAPIKNMLDAIQLRKQNLLRGGQQPAAQPQASGQQAPAPVQSEASAPSPTPAPEGKIKVRLKATGQTGSLDPKDFDPSKYDKI